MFAKLVTAGPRSVGNGIRCRPYGYIPDGFCSTGYNPVTGICGNGLIN